MLRGMTAPEALDILSGWEEAIKSGDIYGFGLSSMLFYNSPAYLRDQDEFRFKGFFDNNRALWGQKVLGFPIHSPDEIGRLKGSAKIVVFAGDYLGIRRQLAEAGLEEKRDFVKVFDFWPMLGFYRYDKISLYRGPIAFPITFRCTLNCDHCHARVPDVRPENSVDQPLDVLKRDLATLAEKIDFFLQLTIAGGEPLLHPGLNDFLDFVFENYSHRIAVINLNSNGTIAPGPELLARIKKYRVAYRLSDYSEAGISGYAERLKKTIETAARAGVRPTIVTGYWAAMTPDADRQRILDNLDEAGKRRHFAECCNAPLEVLNGRFHPCGHTLYNEQCGRSFPEDSIDLNDFDMAQFEDRRRFLMYMMGYFHNPCLATCETCVGWGEDKTFPFPEVKVPRAVQRPRGTE